MRFGVRDKNLARPQQNHMSMPIAGCVSVLILLLNRSRILFYILITR